MNQRSKAPARVLATTALVAALIALVVAISGSVGGGDSNGTGGQKHGGQVTRKDGSGKDEAPAAYVVQGGDTLTSIAHKTGVSVSQIEALNPGVDPQILISGEKLKLR